MDRILTKEISARILKMIQVTFSNRLILNVEFMFIEIRISREILLWVFWEKIGWCRW